MKTGACSPSQPSGLGSPVSEVFYWDQSKEPNMRDDKKLLKRLWKLLDEADIVITQNGKSFDEKKANARFIINGLPPPKPFKHIDTKQLAKKRFCFTSNKLEYLAEALGVPFKKLKLKEFPGMELWTECLKRNKRAWAEMKLYNIADVLPLKASIRDLLLGVWGSISTCFMEMQFIAVPAEAQISQREAFALRLLANFSSMFAGTADHGAPLKVQRTIYSQTATSFT
jgi:hypothetical protein